MQNLSLIFLGAVSDTGIGTSLEEFQGLKFSREVFDAEKWGKFMITAY